MNMDVATNKESLPPLPDTHPLVEHAGDDANTPQLQELLSEVDTGSIDRVWEAIEVAVKNGCLGNLKVLIPWMAENYYFSVERAENTFFSVAASKGDTQVLLYLMEQAHISARTRDLKLGVALEEAARTNQLETFKILFEYEFEISAPDDFYESISELLDTRFYINTFEIAKKNYSTKIVEYLGTRPDPGWYNNCDDARHFHG